MSSPPNGTDQPESAPAASPQTCPECDGEIIRSTEEAVCQQCGLVVTETPVDTGPEWRAFDSQERDRKSRVGPPTTNLHHDKGLSTDISWKDVDARGRQVDAGKRAQLRRLRQWNQRLRPKNANERNLQYALGEINRMASALDIPPEISEMASVIYRQALEDGLLAGRSIEGMATAALYAAAKQQGLPRTLDAFVTVSRIEKLRIQRAYRYTVRELGLEIEPLTALEYLPSFASVLAIGEHGQQLAQELLDVARETNTHSGKDPASLAAAALYAASHLTGDRLTQKTVSRATQVSEATIRIRYQELLDVYASHSE